MTCNTTETLLLNNTKLIQYKHKVTELQDNNKDQNIGLNSTQSIPYEKYQILNIKHNCTLNEPNSNSSNSQINTTNSIKNQNSKNLSPQMKTDTENRDYSCDKTLRKNKNDSITCPNTIVVRKDYYQTEITKNGNHQLTWRDKLDENQNVRGALVDIVYIENFKSYISELNELDLIFIDNSDNSKDGIKRSNPKGIDREKKLHCKCAIF